MEHDPNRRMLIAALAGLSLANVSLAAAASGNANVQGKSPILVAYFSRSGNTRVVAGVIHRSLNSVHPPSGWWTWLVHDNEKRQGQSHCRF